MVPAYRTFNLCPGQRAGQNSTSVHDTDTGPQQRYVYIYSDIFILKENARTYYLAIQNGIFSTKDMSEGIIAFTIENGKLTDSTKIFMTDEGLANEMNFDFDFFKVAKGNERPVKLISYNSQRKTISILKINEDGKPTGKYDLYRFTGKYFENRVPEIHR